MRWFIITIVVCGAGYFTYRVWGVHNLTALTIMGLGMGSAIDYLVKK